MIYNLLKRLLDILFSSVAIIVLSPLIVPILVGLRFTGEGYIFYKQERGGYKNKPFLIWKFATILKDSPNLDGGLVTISGDPRITPMGGFLRKSKINELPQLFNILFGHMSIVGPRLLATKMFSLYDQKIQVIVGFENFFNLVLSHAARILVGVMPQKSSKLLSIDRGATFLAYGPLKVKGLTPLLNKPR